MDQLPHIATGARIKEARDRARLKQRELAEKLSIHPMTLSKWERGERQPGGQKLIEIGRILNVSPAWVLGYQGSAGDFSPEIAGSTVEMIASAILVVERIAKALETNTTPLSTHAKAQLVARLLKLCQSEGISPSEVPVSQLLVG